MAIVDLDGMLMDMIAKDASDLYLLAGARPQFSIHGEYHDAADEVLSHFDTEEYADIVMAPNQKEEFARTMEMNLSYSLPGKGRFRTNIFKQRGSVGLVIRQIQLEVPSLSQMRLPEILGDLIMAHNGLILVTGAAGSGKSTTFAAMINHRNSQKGGHIITIEDPIEFVHQNKKSIVSQREITTDTVSFSEALKNTLRQAPEVIYIGEIRDAEVMNFALHASDTGHLALGTLHSINANQTIERIINFFPREFQNQILFSLSLNLRAIVSQRLIQQKGGGRIPAHEILIRTAFIQQCIQRGEIQELKAAMRSGEQDGLRTFDMDLQRLFERGMISEEEALANADSPNDLKMRLAGIT